MHILVLNCGSSSIKAHVVDHYSGQHLLAMSVERLTAQTPVIHLGGQKHKLPEGTDHQQALEVALPKLLDHLPEAIELRGVGHRVVHGGANFSHPVRITDEVEKTIESLSDLAPLHNPINLAGIRAARAVLPDLCHVAVFDTAFHATLPTRARAYALPQELVDDADLRRYGFHGISHGYVAQLAADHLQADLRELRLITCHLGNGASVCAVEYGRSIETSMGLTPLEGLVMGTRSGDIDPGILIHLLRNHDFDVDALDELLNKESGLAGLSGRSNDMRDIQEKAAEGDEQCRLAIQVFAHRLRKYIGAYAAVMGGVDAIVFTGGIGENSAIIRHRVAQRLDFLGAHLDEDENRTCTIDDDHPVARVSTATSRTHLLAVRTDESHAIAGGVSQLLLAQDQLRGQRAIPVAISARHLHLRQETVERLFGKGYELTPRNDLSQPGQFAAEETVRVIGPRNEFKEVRILGPTRDINQVEISRTDEFFLGIDAPVRASGDIENTPGITLEGPDGRVTLDQGVICAWRHIHMTPDDAEHFGVADRDVVEVAVSSGDRDLVFGDVLVRVSPNYALEMHIDTDEGNAANLGRDATGSLVSTEGTASLRRRKTTFDPLDQAAE